MYLHSTAIAWRENNCNHFVSYKIFCLVLGLEFKNKSLVILSVAQLLTKAIFFQREINYGLNGPRDKNQHHNKLALQKKC
jgi:hypothetical protein